MKYFTLALLAVISLTMCANNDQHKRHVTTADYGLKGDILEVSIEQQPVVSPQLLEPDSANERSAIYCSFKDNILQSYRIVDGKDSTLMNVIYTYNTDKGGRYRLSYNTKPDGTIWFETFLISDDGLTSVEKGINPDSSLNYKYTLKRNKQLHTQEDLAEHSDGCMVVTLDSCNEQMYVLKRKLTISPRYAERINRASTFAYLSYDEQKNWTRRLETRIAERDTAYILETQTITYKE